MVTIVEYALMAGASYYDTRAEINRLPIPTGWNLLSRNPQDNATGFEASAFGNATTIAESTEIVISFAGTDYSSVTDWLTNGGLVVGFGSWQLRQATEYYMQVKAINPNADITFTGHSLGGGLAALMGVFFNEKAVTFDQALFGNSANSLVAADLLTYLKAEFPVATYPQIAVWLDPLDRIVRSVDGFSAREVNVTNTIVQGEFLSMPPFSLLPRIGSQEPPLTQGTPDLLLAFDLHSQALLTAFLQSDAFRQVTFKLPDLLKMVFSKELFAHSTARSNTTEENFLDRLIRHEFGNAPGATDTDMLTRFTADLWKIAQGGMAQNNDDINKALIVAGMEYYYFKDSASTTALFTAAGNGLHFKYSDIGASSYKSLPLLARAIETLLGPAQSFQTGIYGRLIKQDAWHIQSGSAGMTWTATGADNDAAIGGDQADDLDAGAGNDVLLGFGGSDTLTGGIGDDLLMGGAGADTLDGGDGYDTYIIEGNDTIRDSDGKGRIRDKAGNIIAGGIEKLESGSYVYLADPTVGVAVGSSLILTWTDGSRIDIEGFNNGDLGFVVTNFIKELEPQNVILGDQLPLISHYQVTYYYDEWGKEFPVSVPVYQFDVWGNIIPIGPGPGADTIYDTDGNDLIEAGDGGDTVVKKRGGNDIIELGEGDDEFSTTASALGRVIVRGGDGRDYIVAGSDDDILLAMINDSFHGYSFERSVA
ncbi:MAG: DUF2974 domain-containing protein [Gammaproteobacteria bacterium]|nr:DUF2974 domain-containing protein [Gammaproteobacteria bacterium]